MYRKKRSVGLPSLVRRIDVPIFLQLAQPAVSLVPKLKRLVGQRADLHL